ncbi:tyrosine-type recombinase/integrase [Thermodesulfobacteriota bacterium]
MAKRKNDKYLQKRGGIFYFRKRHNKATFKRSLNTTDMKTAQDLRDIYLSNLIEYGQLYPPTKPFVEVPTFGEMAKQWAENHRSQVRYTTWPDYVSAMNGHILPIFKNYLITEITYQNLFDFRKKLKVGSKRANNIMVPMKSVFDFAHRQEVIQDNVVRDLKRLPEEAPEIHPFTYAEVNRILDAIHPWYKPYASVAFFTGMRAGEQNGLAWSDFLVDMKPESHIFIHKTYVYKRESIPKTKKSKRYISCLPQVLDALAEQRKLTGNNKYIFLTVDGRRMTPDHFRKEVWMPALEKAGLEYRPAIQMRHTFATMMLSAGEDIGWVQNMLGHSSLQMIFQRYFAWIPKETRSDGKAFLRSIEDTAVKPPETSVDEGAGNPETDKVCTNIVPLAEYWHKKRGLGMP